MKTIDEMMKVMQAYEDGKEIEFQGLFEEEKEWVYVEYPSWDWYSNDYRVKPEPKYVPYDSVAEVERDKWVVLKNSKRILRRISMIDLDENAISVAGCFRSMKDLFENFEYEDGTPCGKLKGE